MQILSEDGNVIEDFVTTNETYTSKNLEAGKSYILRELEAPEGYERAEDIKFTVTEDKDQVIKMVDNDLKGYIVFKDIPKFSGGVKTGDVGITFTVLTLMGSSLTLAVLGFKRRKYNK